MTTANSRIGLDNGFCMDAYAGNNSVDQAPTSINEMAEVGYQPISAPSEAIVELRANLLQWTKYKTDFIQKFWYMTYGFKYLSFYVIATMFR